MSELGLHGDHKLVRLCTCFDSLNVKPCLGGATTGVSVCCFAMSIRGLGGRRLDLVTDLVVVLGCGMNTGGTDIVDVFEGGVNFMAGTATLWLFVRVPVTGDLGDVEDIGTKVEPAVEGRGLRGVIQPG